MTRVRMELGAALILVFGSTAMAGMLGSPVDLTTSETGTTTINPLGGPFSSTVGAGAEYGFCVGPNGDGCVSSGLSGAVDIGDTSVTFGFTGSTDPTTGTFVLQLTGFTPVITNVTYQSGSLFSGSFGLSSFTDHSMTFTGSTGSDFDAVGGATITFDIASRDVVAAPEPSSLFMAGMGLLGLGFGAFRRRVRG